MSDMRNLLPEPPATLLPADESAAAALAAVRPGQEAEVAARFPASSAAWAVLAERALAAGDPVTAYAYARTGYHRGLDQLGRAADAIGEDDEAARCAQFLRDCDPSAADALTG